MKDTCVINVETTGLNPFEDEILEIGIIRLGKGEGITARFSSLVWPGEEIFKKPDTKRVLKVLGRKVDDFRIAPSSEDVAKHALSFIGDWRTTQIAAYNVHFERAFLQRKAWERIGKGYPWPISIMLQCAETMGKAGSPLCPWNEELKTYRWPRLIDAIHFFRVRYDPQRVHDALHKAEMAAGILLALPEHVEDPAA